MTERIGVYRVEGRLGRGGMGEVLLAWDDRLERRVAIKRIRQDEGLSAEQRERFRREARLAARLNHSSVVQIHDLVTEGPDDAIVMEYVEGQTLAECLKSGPLALDEALRLGREIAEGLAAAHEAGLIHRDLKAANVIVTKARRAKILDFGLARPVIHPPEEEPITRHGMVMGTFHAMSPEQARGEDLDERSDLFSFGALLYEMLTGRAPFRGRDAVDSLRRVVQEPPADPRSLRPDLPAEVAALLDRLLAKDRRDRPAGAGEVVAILERLRPVSGSAPSFERDTVSDLPTAPARPLAEPVLAIQPKAESLPSSLVSTALHSRRRLWIAASLVALLVVVSATLFLTGAWPSRAPLRIAVAPVEVIPADDERLALAGSGVVTAVLSTLNGLQGLAPIDPREAARGGKLPVDIARVTAAKDVLIAEVRRQGELAQVTLSRIQGDDGQVLWTETFPVPINGGEFRTLADAVAIKLRKAYGDHDVRKGVPELDFRDEDYAEFLKVQARIDAGAIDVAPELQRLEQVIQSSPRFLEAYLLAARIAHNLFLARREVSDLDRAAGLVRKARKLAPADPRPLRQELQVALSANQLQDAQRIVDQLAQLLPGDPAVLPSQAQLAERQDRLEEAARLLSAAVEQVPSWQNIFRLATLEAKRGRIKEARLWFYTILRQMPDNAWALEAIGQLEIQYGDLRRAEAIYSKSVGSTPRKSLNNLAMVHFLRGHYQEAADTYRQALALQPDYVITLINLADAEVELGQRREADTHYRQALANLEKTEKALGLSQAEAMLKAQCLVRLGHPREAVELAQAQIRKNPDDPNLLQQSALVHSLAGERTTALNNALDALDKGMQVRWFESSALAWLRESPEFRSRITHGG